MLSGYRKISNGKGDRQALALTLISPHVVWLVVPLLTLLSSARVGPQKPHPNRFLHNLSRSAGKVGFQKVGFKKLGSATSKTQAKRQWNPQRRRAQIRSKPPSRVPTMLDFELATTLRQRIQKRCPKDQQGKVGVWSGEVQHVPKLVGMRT